MATVAQKCVAEFVGTYLLVFTIGCNVLSKTPVWAPVSIACVLMVAIYALGGVSGANFNPAVSLSIGISTAMKGPGDMPWKTVGMYIGVQLFAGIIAAFSYAVLFWNAFNLGPSKGFGLLSAGYCELFYTFMLCFVVLNVAVSRDATAPNAGATHFFGLAIGFVIIAGAYGAGAISGGCFNPAVAFGIDLSSAGLGFGWCIWYTIFEFIGAALAAVCFKIVRPADFGASPTDTRLYASEFLGTFMLVLTVGLNVLGHSPAGAFSIAASLMCMIYALGDVSGANFNPAVTVAILASRSISGADMTPAKAGKYIVVQIIGGIVAALTYSGIHGGKSFPLGPSPGFSWGQVAVAEIVFTFVLCYIVLCCAVSDGNALSANTKQGTMFGLAIGMCVTVGGCAIGKISGGSLNPAVSFGIASSQLLSGGMFYKAIFYTIFELAGALLAAGVFNATHKTSKQMLGSTP